VAKCENCHNCFLATKDEHVGNDFPGYAAPQPLHGHQWIDLRRHERGQYPMVDVNFMPVMCNQCDNAPCIDARKDGAVYKRPDGIVIIDPVKAHGQKDIIASCPYGAIWWNEELQLPQKWIFDAHLLDNGWTKTRAEQVCGTGALRSVNVTDEDMAAIVRKESLDVLLPERSTKPRVYYKNLHLMTTEFIGGTVVNQSSGLEECVEGADVTISKQGTVIAKTSTDTYGEFRFDGLGRNSGVYEVSISHARYGSRPSRTVELDGSVYIGVIEIA
jgi:Fe-S-cluster-containing dehydrogenase component